MARAVPTSWAKYASLELPQQLSTIEWPETWDVVRLGDALSFIGNGLTSEQNKSGEGYPISRIETISDDGIHPERVGFVRDVSAEAVKKFQLQNGDILLSHINSEPQIGRSVVYEGRPALLLHGMNLLRLRVQPGRLEPAFLDYLLKFYRMRGVFIALASRAVGQASINQGKLSALVVPVPPLPEQRAIARALQAVQDTILARSSEVELERERRAALMQQMFTYGTRGEPTKQAEIGEMPESWYPEHLGTLAGIQSGGTPLRQKIEYFGGAIPWVKTLDLTNSDVSATEERITEAGLKSIRGKVRSPETVMVAMYGGAGTIGKTGILTVPAATNQAVCCIEVDRARLHPRFLLHYLNFIRPTWMLYAIGTRKDPNISKATIERMQVPLPSLAEQAAIADALDAVGGSVRALDHEVVLLAELFCALLEELMTGRLSALPLVGAETQAEAEVPA